ncbi:MAG: hypothetical protein K2X72_06035 [Reyranella sp.]|nr:hypothetical protein [Reyranella sp.]
MSNDTSTKLDLALQAHDFFVKEKWTREQSAGLIANIEAESAFDHQAVGDGGQAFGICQWHPDRQAGFQRQFGYSIKDADYVAQLAFVVFELSNAEQLAGRALRGTTTADEAGRVICRLYERPDDPQGQVRRRRGALAQEWFDRLP